MLRSVLPVRSDRPRGRRRRPAPADGFTLRRIRRAVMVPLLLVADRLARRPGIWPVSEDLAGGRAGWLPSRTSRSGG